MSSGNGSDSFRAKNWKILGNGAGPVCIKNQENPTRNT